MLAHLAIISTVIFVQGRRLQAPTATVEQTSGTAESAGATKKSLASLLMGPDLMSAFAVPAVHRVRPGAASSSLAPQPRVQPSMSALDVLKGPLQSYSEIWIPYFKEAQAAGLVSDFLIHWGHPAAMATVLLTMVNFGAYLGWQTRLGNGNDKMLLTLGQTYRQMHPLLMSGALFFFFLGGQGGIVLTALQGRNLLESTHATTAFLGLGLMVLQAALPYYTKFAEKDFTRTAHAYLGSATMAVLYFHMVAGLQVGFSF